MSRNDSFGCLSVCYLPDNFVFPSLKTNDYVMIEMNFINGIHQWYKNKALLIRWETSNEQRFGFDSLQCYLFEYKIRYISANTYELVYNPS